MTAQLIDGKAIAQQVRQEVAEEVARRAAAGTVADHPMGAMALMALGVIRLGISRGGGGERRDAREDQ